MKSGIRALFTVLLLSPIAAPAQTPAARMDYRYPMPRSDLTVTTRGVRVQPALSPGSWLALVALGRTPSRSGQ